MTFRVKRVYDAPSPDDGFRVLVDRLWPRGLTRSSASVDLWLREVAPSEELRRWYGHRPERWEEFRARYFAELDRRPDLVEALLRLERERGTVTLLFAARDRHRNNAVALLEYLQGALSRRS